MSIIEKQKCKDFIKCHAWTYNNLFKEIKKYGQFGWSIVRKMWLGREN